MRRSLTFGTKSHLSHVISLGNWRLDQWFVGGMAGSRELGYYSVAVSWAEALYILPGALRNVQRRISSGPPGEAGRQAARVFRVCVLVTLPPVLIMLAAAPLLCEVVFGAEFSESVDDLRWLLPGTFGIVALRLLGDALIAQRRPVLVSAATGSPWCSRSSWTSSSSLIWAGWARRSRRPWPTPWRAWRSPPSSCAGSTSGPATCSGTAATCRS